MSQFLWLIPVSFLLGYLVNYMADVIPQEGKTKRPVCVNCFAPFKLIDYFLFRKCANCSQRIKIRFFVVQIVSILLPVIISILAINTSAITLLFSFLFILIFHSLFLIFIIDMENKVIYYFTCIISIIIIAPVSIFRAIVSLNKNWIDQLLGLLIGSAICAVIFGLGYLFVKIVNIKRKSPLQDVAFGFGDVILGGILGLWVGYPGIFLCMILAIIAGGFVSAIYLLVKKLQHKYQPLTAIPYAPFMIASAVLLMFYSYFLK